tara:strand:- start:253 stop:1032 length:780 start_codon:yes stop_codon:yes gene_type:complete
MIVQNNNIFFFNKFIFLFFLLIIGCDKKDDSSSSSKSGCNDIYACNYDDDATDNDGSCEYCYSNNCDIYPLSKFDCNGECIVDIDCLEVCGGASEEDNCGLCDSNPYNDCELIDGDWTSQLELYACSISYLSGKNAVITVCGECIDTCTNCLDCEVSGFQFDIFSQNFSVNEVSATSFLENAGIFNQSSEGNVIAFGTGPNIYVNMDSNPLELFEFEVEYSDNSGKIFIIPTKGSISAINRDGEELSVSVKNKKWSSID